MTYPLGLRLEQEEFDERDFVERDDFSDCGRGNRAPRDCWCDRCVNAGDDEYHRRRDEGWF